MPISISLLKQVLADQREEHQLPVSYFNRQLENKLRDFAATKEIVVLKGVRRCGKSVLLHRIRQEQAESDYYFNFEDERLVNFLVEDFQLLHTAFIEVFGVQKTFYFDEIQNIPGWEMFVRRLYNSNNKIFITGSNANLFSEELGTRLTGRYLALEIYPLSFREYVERSAANMIAKENFSTNDIGTLKNLFNQYCVQGGIPEYLKNDKIEYLSNLYESILYRDIITRYKISNDVAFKKLVFYLASNCSKETSYNALKKVIDLGSATTLSNYCSYLENSYLCFFVNRYSDSVKVQIQSPKKVYFIDHALTRILGFRFSEEAGRMLENIVYIELRRRNYEIYYYSGQRECDFVVRHEGRHVAAIQVSQDISDPSTKQREFSGLLEALKRFDLQEGYLLTADVENIEEVEDESVRYKIRLLPLWKWLLLPASF